MNHRHAPVLEVVRNQARRLDDPERDLDALIQAIGQRPFVLLGEASHGTHEFYELRASLTRRLLGQHGFDAVALEADWPDALSLNRHVRGESGMSLDTAFGAFERFPTWMWRNRPMHAFVDWLAQHNASLPMAQRCGIYGLDLYSLYRSADAVIQYLEQVDPDQATIARQMYAALDHVRDPQDYGMQAAAGLRPSCRTGAAGMLVELLRKAPQYLASDGLAAAERQFEAERNASVVMNAEHYYRAMFGRRQNTWNLRDAHMVDTLQALRRHLRQLGRGGRIVVWAHNSHLGDARATQMGQRGEWNIGQLMREQAGTDQVYSVGFTTHTGHVTAARDWDHPAERRWVRPSRATATKTCSTAPAWNASCWKWATVPPKS